MRQLKIEQVNIKDINEYSNNAKLHPDWQIEQIANSIKKFGFNDPIAINENNTIIEGHGRYIACKRLGFEEVPCIRLAGMTDTEERAYILAHNKLTMNTDFDIDALQLELNALQIEDFDLELTGFNQEEVIEILECDEFDDNLEIPNDEEDESQDSADVQLRVLKCGSVKCRLSDEEYELLLEKYEEYTNTYSTNYGFINHILGEE